MYRYLAEKLISQVFLYCVAERPHPNSIETRSAEKSRGVYEGRIPTKLLQLSYSRYSALGLSEPKVGPSEVSVGDER